MSTLLSDLRSAWRAARVRPGLAAFEIAILALGIGAAAAVFVLLDAVVVRALPFRDPGRLVWMWNARVERDRAPFSIPDLADYQAASHVLDGLAPFTNWTANLIGVGEAERLEGVLVAPGFFDVLGADAALGRVPGAGDDPASKVVVLTDRLWRRRFGADPAVLGRTINLNGAGYVVAAVLPRGFVFPFRTAELAVPLALASNVHRGQRGYGFLRVVARLKPGVTLGAAKADLDAIGRRLRQQYPDDDGKKTGVNLFPLQDEIVGDGRALLVTLMAAVGLLLLIACANLTNLVGAGLSSRRGEVAIRLALGASRLRVARQLLTETAAVVAAGGALGLVIADWLVRGLVWWAGPSLPRLDEVRMDPRAVAFTAAVTAAAALVCGGLPALQLARSGGGDGVDTRGATPSASQQRLRRSFVVVQIAGSLVLLVVLALTVRGFVNLQQVDAGFRPDGVLTMQLSMPPARYATAPALVEFADRLRPRLEAIPGVRRAAAISLLPLAGLLRTEDYRVVGRPAPPPDEVPQAHYRVVTPGYFAAMGIAMARGREFTDDDRETTARVAIVSRTFAAREWPAGDPVGAHVVFGNAPDALQIVGVAADVKQFSLDAPPTADLYVPLRQMPASEASLVASRTYWVARVDGDPLAVASEARAEVRRLDGDIATSGPRSLRQVRDDALEARRFSATLLSLFGQAAVLLAAMGVYAVTAFAVGRRTREIGVRVAFGATGRDIVSMIVTAEFRGVAVGLAIGLATAAVAARLVARTLFMVDPFDPWTLTLTTGLLAGVSALASYLPARRALRVDPVEALRTN